MRAQRAYGRPGTAVIPPNWGASHAPVADGTRNAVVTLRRPSTMAWDESANDGKGATVPTPGAAYASNVTARIQALITRSDNDAESAEETITAPPYLVTLGHEQPCREGDEIEVTACVGDALLVDRFLRVDHVVLGTERVERDVLCTLIEAPPT